LSPALCSVRATTCPSWRRSGRPGSPPTPTRRAGSMRPATWCMRCCRCRARRRWCPRPRVFPSRGWGGLREPGSSAGGH